jgi:hypothetical protein
LENTLTSKAPSKWLESFVGKDFILTSSNRENIFIEGKNPGNLTVYKPEFCFAVIQHYAFQQNEVAQDSSMQFGVKGFNQSVQEITGWKKSDEKKPYIPYWYKREPWFFLAIKNHPIARVVVNHIRSGFFSLVRYKVSV